MEDKKKKVSKYLPTFKEKKVRKQLVEADEESKEKEVKGLPIFLVGTFKFYECPIYEYNKYRHTYVKLINAIWYSEEAKIPLTSDGIMEMSNYLFEFRMVVTNEKKQIEAEEREIDEQKRPKNKK